MSFKWDFIFNSEKFIYLHSDMISFLFPVENHSTLCRKTRYEAKG